jgi:hypothetical protein
MKIKLKNNRGKDIGEFQVSSDIMKDNELPEAILINFPSGSPELHVYVLRYAPRAVWDYENTVFSSPPVYRQARTYTAVLAQPYTLESPHFAKAGT